jgi:hypothetical protein
MVKIPLRISFFVPTWHGFEPEKALAGLSA